MSFYSYRLVESNNFYIWFFKFLKRFIFLAVTSRNKGYSSSWRSFPGGPSISTVFVVGPTLYQRILVRSQSTCRLVTSFPLVILVWHMITVVEGIKGIKGRGTQTISSTLCVTRVWESTTIKGPLFLSCAHTCVCVSDGRRMNLSWVSGQLRRSTN